MIQVLGPGTQRQSFAQRLGAGVGEGLKKGLELYQQHQKQKQFQQALQGLEEQYEGNPEQQQLVRAYRALAGAGHPELGFHLGSQLSRLGAQQQKSKAEQLRGQQQQEKTAQAFQNIQQIYSDPNLSEEQKVFGVYQQLAENPSLAHHLQTSLQQQRKAQGQDVAGQRFAEGYGAIQEGDDASLKEILEDETTPLPVKQKLTALKDRADVRKSVQSRELRNRQSLVQRSYKSAIDSEEKKLKQYLPKAEKAAVEKSIKRLKALRQSDLKRLSKDPETYTNLSLWSHVDPDFLPSEEDFVDLYEEEGEERPIVKFDPSNPEHMARFEELDKEFKGDRKKVNAAMAKEFSL